MKTPYYLVTDGELTLRLWPAEEGGYNVTCPWDPALITQAESMEEAFEMAYDAQEALLEARKLRDIAPTAAQRPGSGAGTAARGAHAPVADSPEPAVQPAPVEDAVQPRLRRRVIRAGETVPIGRPKGK
jgi:antitoxin HicB